MLPRPQTANSTHTARFTYVVSANVAATDIIEIGALPAYARVVDASVVAEGAFGAVTAKVGFMSGTFGSTDDTRTVGNEFIAAAALDGTIGRLNKIDALLVDAGDADKGIGVQFSAAVTGAATKKIHVILSFVQ